MSEDLVRVSGGSFSLGGKPYRFVGANMYELAYVSDREIAGMLRSASEQGFSVVRFWAFASVDIRKLEFIVRESEKLSLRLIPVFGDMNEFLQGFRADDEWFRNGFKGPYTENLQRAAEAFKGCGRILLWELFNEPSASSPEIIRNFCKEAGNILKQSDLTHPVSLGTIGGIGDRFGGWASRFNPGNFRRLYELEQLDAVSMHDYSFSATLFERADLYYRLKSEARASALFGKLDLIWNALPQAVDEFTVRRFGRTFSFPLTVRGLWKFCNSINLITSRELGKPVYIGEIGIKKGYGELRKKILLSELEAQFRKGVSGALLWSFEASGRSLDGHDYGFSEADGFGDIAKSLI